MLPSKFNTKKCVVCDWSLLVVEFIQAKWQQHPDLRVWLDLREDVRLSGPWRPPCWLCLQLQRRLHMSPSHWFLSVSAGHIVMLVFKVQNANKARWSQYSEGATMSTSQGWNCLWGLLAALVKISPRWFVKEKRAVFSYIFGPAHCQNGSRIKLLPYTNFYLEVYGTK